MCLQFEVINSVIVTTAGVSQRFLTALRAERGEILCLCLQQRQECVQRHCSALCNKISLFREDEVSKDLPEVF